MRHGIVLQSALEKIPVTLGPLVSNDGLNQNTYGYTHKRVAVGLGVRACRFDSTSPLRYHCAVLTWIPNLDPGN